MTKFIINVPNSENQKWYLSINSARIKRLSIHDLLKAFRNRLAQHLGSCEGQKTCVKVKYDEMYHNETLTSDSLEYLIYATTCFLEDYISSETMRKAEKRYFLN